MDTDSFILIEGISAIVVGLFFINKVQHCISRNTTGSEFVL